MPSNDDDVKDKDTKLPDKGDDKGGKDDKPQVTLPPELEAKLKTLDRLSGALEKLDKVDEIDKTVNLLRAQVLDPDFFDKRIKSKSDDKPDDKSGAKGFDELPWDEMTNKELAAALVQELNTVLNTGGKKYDDAISDLATELDVTKTIIQISEDENCTVKEARAKFNALSADMEELADKFPTISAADAYKIASKIPKESKDKEKKEDKGERSELIKELAKELRGGGGKPGGPSDLDSKTPAETRAVVAQKYDELFPGKGE